MSANIASGAAADTLTERAYARVEGDILHGALTPGARIGITETAARYGIGATPLREALSRLAAKGLVTAVGQRGFRVRETSREDLADIVCIRTAIEKEALRRSIASGDDAWEGEIVATLHRLRRYVLGNAKSFVEGVPEFDALHKKFHTSLINACGSPRLMAAQSDLYDQAYRYRRLMMAKFTDPEEFMADHERLARLAIERATDAACERLQAHIGSTLAFVYPSAKLGA